MARRPQPAPERTPDESFLDRHIEIVQGMAFRMARQFHCLHELEDVERTAILGLVKAAASYRSDSGTTERFWAWSCIRLEVLSAYACGSKQHSGGDGYEYATRCLPIDTALYKPTPEPLPPPPPLPHYAALTPRQQALLELIYDEGVSARRIAREHLVDGAHSVNTVLAEHTAALQTLRQELAACL